MKSRPTLFLFLKFEAFDCKISCFMPYFDNSYRHFTPEVRAKVLFFVYIQSDWVTRDISILLINGTSVLSNRSPKENTEMHLKIFILFMKWKQNFQATQCMIDLVC